MRTNCPLEDTLLLTEEMDSIKFLMNQPFEWKKTNILLHIHLLKVPIAGSITLCPLLADPLVCICSGAIYRQSLTVYNLNIPFKVDLMLKLLEIALLCHREASIVNGKQLNTQ